MRSSATWVILLLMTSGLSGCGESPSQAVRPAGTNTSSGTVLSEMLPKTDAGDWPWWRGPSLDNKAEQQDVPLTWSEEFAEVKEGEKKDPDAKPKWTNIRWKSAVPGRGLSSPSIWGDLIFLTTANEEKESIHLLCYRRSDGAPQWNTTLHNGGFLTTHKKNSQASPTVACDGTAVYVPHVVHHEDQDGVWVSAVDMGGNILWQQPAGKFTSLHGYGASPVIYGDLLIVSGDNGESGFLAALDRQTGKVRWRVDRKKDYSFATPTVAHVAGRDQLLIHGTLLVTSYDPQTGEELWRCDGPSKSAANTMVADSERVYASGGYPEKVLLAIRADGRGDVTKTHIEWKTQKRICYVPTMMLHENRLYGINDTGRASCYIADTGEEVWKATLPGDFSASPTLVGDRLYIPNEAGKMYVLKTGDKFEILAENDLADGGFATPVIVGGRIYLRTDHHLYCIGNK